MKYAIVTSSKTGNTKQLGDMISECLFEQEIIYCGPPEEKAKEADIGFWTDKGTCDEETKKFLNHLEQKKVFLFGTAGFGGSESYFKKILDRVRTEVNTSNEIIGTYMCQGKMPLSVRKRYEILQMKNPEDKKYEMLIENFDQALSHPNQEDKDEIKQIVCQIVDENVR